MNVPLPPFDPNSGTDAKGEEWKAVFPDVDGLIAESQAKHGVCDTYRVSRVPRTSVYILYGIRWATKTIVLVQIETFRGVPN